jgi:uncharacterized repeat protein (TIGR02543 family)
MLNHVHFSSKKRFTVLLLSAALLSGVTHAATYTVTNLKDSGAGSLRQAIADANATYAVADTIEFQSGLTGTITLASQLDITDNLTITGSGIDILAISGDKKNRIFTVKAFKTTITGLTLQDGKSDFGAAILNKGTLTLKQLTFKNNDAIYSGGAIDNEGVLTASDLNLANNSSGSSGGAFFNNATATINDSTFSVNSAPSAGAIQNESGAKLTMNNVVLTGNSSTSNEGGAISNFGMLSLTAVTILGNQSKGYGAGIYNGGTASINNSAFLQNRTGEDNGGAINNGNTLTVNNSTFSENYAGGSGGALYFGNGEATLLNNTFTANYAASYGGAVHRNGGGDTLKIGNTISIGNFAPSAPEISGFTSLGNNLFGSNGNAGVSAGLATTDLILAGDPETVLAEVADNGGPTQTHALITGSPAIDAGSDELLPVDLITDQRGEGFARIVGDRVDIGAFEYGNSGAAVKNQLNVSIDPTNTGTVTSDVTGINCGGDCAESYDANKSIKLTAKPAAGYVFSKWTGACTGTTTTCTVTMDQPRSVTATFNAAPVSYSLTLTKVGNGTVTSVPAGINCGTGTGCAAKFASGKTITLTAVPATGATFVKWTGCTASATDSKKCTLTLTANKTVIATFSSIPAATADFSITNINLTPATPVKNGLFYAKITVKNNGTSTADGGTLSVWTNRSTKPVCSTGGDQAVMVGKIDAGKTKVLTIKELAAGAAGAKILYAFVDSKCVTQETDETNNQRTKSYTVK